MVAQPELYPQRVCPSQPIVEYQYTGAFAHPCRLAGEYKEFTSVFLFLPDAAVVEGDLSEFQLGAAVYPTVRTRVSGRIFSC